MSASIRTDHLGRRIAVRFVEIDLVVWRGANVCAMCGSMRHPAIHLGALCCVDDDGFAPPFEWNDGAQDVRVIAQWQANGADFDHPAAMVRFGDIFGRTSFEAPFTLTAEEWAEAERKRDEHQSEAHHG
jgi:hypothetical protein